MNKEDARRRSRAQKSMLTDRERRQAAIDVFEQLEQLAAFMMADRILMYHSLPDELSTLDFLERWHDRKKFFLPRVNGVNLDLLPYDRSRLRLGAFHIEEPTGDDIADIADMELMVIPAMAYDSHGNRVGRGKGFYDRLLARSKAVKVGVAFDCQMVDDIETDPFDQPVDIVITQSRTYFRSRKR